MCPESNPMLARSIRGRPPGPGPWSSFLAFLFLVYFAAEVARPQPGIKLLCISYTSPIEHTHLHDKKSWSINDYAQYIQYIRLVYIFMQSL